MLTGVQKAQLGIVANLSYQFSTNQRISFENFYTHSGRDEGRFFEGQNLDNARDYQNSRLQFIEEGLMANAIGGEHFFQNLSNSRFDWRANFARATRDEPDLRETLYERPLNSAANVVYTYADESQSGFRMFNDSRRRHGRRGAELGDAQRCRRKADAVQVRLRLRGSQSRLPVTALPLHPHHDAEGGHRQPSLRQHAPAGADLRREQYRHRVSTQRGDAPDRRVPG